MATWSRRIPLSIPAGPDTLSGALSLLSNVDTLPNGSGALQCRNGIVLVESRRICWAAAAGMLPRFGELVNHAHIEVLYRQNREGGIRFTDALLATGRVSASELRAALFSHTVEALAHLAGCSADAFEFVPHARGRYDAEYAFSPVEILACLGARTDRSLAEAARRRLDETLVPETTGWAFVRSSGMSLPLIVAVGSESSFAIAEAQAISRWVTGLFDVTSVFDPGVRIATGGWPDSRAVVAWREDGLHYAALCSNRAGAARLVARLDTFL
jgi:hypothetical protein